MKMNVSELLDSNLFGLFLQYLQFDEWIELKKDPIIEKYMENHKWCLSNVNEDLSIIKEGYTLKLEKIIMNSRQVNYLKDLTKNGRIDSIHKEMSLFYKKYKNIKDNNDIFEFYKKKLNELNSTNKNPFTNVKYLRVKEVDMLLQPIQNINFLKYFENLEYLCLDGYREINDITPLCCLKNLKDLNLSQLEVRKGYLKLENLEKLENLDISMHDNNEDEFITEPPNLKKICINCFGNFRHCLQKIKKFKNINELTIFHNNEDEEDVIDLKEHYFRNFKKLKYLHISNNFGFYIINEIEFPNSLKNLSELFLNVNCIKKIKGLENLKNLKKLDLSYNKIKTIEIEGLENLVELDLSNNEIKEIKGLENLKNLVELDLSHNKIEKFKYKKFENLTHLDLSYNEIEKIPKMSFNKKLKICNLTGNYIKITMGNTEIRF